MQYSYLSERSLDMYLACCLGHTKDLIQCLRHGREAATWVQCPEVLLSTGLSCECVHGIRQENIPATHIKLTK